MQEVFDLIVIGAGPGGYVSAIKAAKLGLHTAVVEYREAGGTCLNRGCIPTKAMIHAAELYRQTKEGQRFGIYAENVRYDYNKILEYKEETSASLRNGVEQLFKANGVTKIKGKAQILTNQSVLVKNEEGESVYQTKNILVATGSKPFLPPIPGMELSGIMTSDEMFQLDHAPDELVIIGGGVIGVEFATVFSSLGCKVTIIEALPRLLANLDKDFSQNLKLILKKRGVDIHTGASVQKISKDGEDFTVTFTEKENEVNVKTKYLLSAVGRAANTDELFAEGISVNMERGKIIVDEKFCTSMEHVYAIGDVIKGIQLAHVASAQGICAVEGIAGLEPTIDLNIVPSCVYTDPEIASIGITEEEAKEKGLHVEVGKFMMSANGKSLISKEERGFIKIVVDKESKVVLGAQMMCARATDMIGEFGTIIENKLTVSDVLKVMRAHPTYNEGVGEAFEELEGGAIHVAPRKKR